MGEEEENRSVLRFDICAPVSKEMLGVCSSGTYVRVRTSKTLDGVGDS